jgi:hypothetical protein
VAEPAIDAQARDVVLMAERKRLSDRPAEVPRPVDARAQDPPGDAAGAERRESKEYRLLARFA